LFQNQRLSEFGDEEGSPDAFNFQSPQQQQQQQQRRGRHAPTVGFKFAEI
jgi:hypothetical protein